PRSLLMAVSTIDWLCSVASWLCHTARGPLFRLIICCTTELTLKPCPERIAAGFRLTPIEFSPFCGRLDRVFWLQFLRNLFRQFEQLSRRDLQHYRAVLVHELVHHNLSWRFYLHFDHIVRNVSGCGLFL